MTLRTRPRLSRNFGRKGTSRGPQHGGRTDDDRAQAVLEGVLAERAAAGAQRSRQRRHRFPGWSPGRADRLLLLLGGDRSPAHLGERLDALAGALPRAKRVVLSGQGHSAHASAPAELAATIESFAQPG
ncbi:hypothetical protein [Streptosporangium sp. KLBMP 9127]|nr:hypothetical protein [Streptosporangium sp. KLBMP 9127]